MIVQIKNIISYCIVLILLVLAVFFYRQSFLVMLFFMMCLLPLFSYFLCKKAEAMLTVDITTASSQAQKGLTVPLSIHFHNPSRIPLLHVECTFSIQSSFYAAKESTTYVLPAPANDSTPLELPVTYAHCGLYQAKISKLRLYDYLHFFSFTKEIDAHTQIIVLPDSTKEVTYHSELYQEGFDEYETTSQKGNASSNVTDIREYIPGDRLQKIHWKLSSKISKLMVKENESTSSHQLFVLLELYRDPDRPNILDDAIEYAYSLSKELLMNQENFFFGFYSTRLGDFLSFPIHCIEDIDAAFCEAFYETPYETENLAKEIYENGNVMKGTLLQVTYKGVLDGIS